MVSTTQNTANLGSASQLVAINLGLDQIPASSWTQDQRILFLAQLSHTILQYPAQFDDATLTSAQVVLGQNLSGMSLADAGGDAWDYVTADGVSLSEVWDYYLGNSVTGQLSSENMGAMVKAGIKAAADVLTNFKNAMVNASTAFNWAIPVGIGLLIYFTARSVGNDPVGTATKAAKGTVAVGKSLFT